MSFTTGKRHGSVMVSSGGRRIEYWAVRVPALVAAGFAAVLLAAPAANAATGALAQKPGTAGCVSETGTGGSCADGKALTGPQSVAVSPDGESAYVASFVDDAVAILDRDPNTGELAQKAGTAGCVSVTGSGGSCVDGAAINGIESVVVSPDGDNVYAASFNSDAVSIFDRDPDTGGLAQKAGTAACVSETGSGGVCVDGVALDQARAVTISPDGESVYVAAGDAVAVFDRDPDTGELTQKAGTDGCISETGSGGSCADGVALTSASSVAVSPDGENAYTASTTSGAVSIFNRDPGTGELTQKAGTAGCISEDGTGGECVDGKGLITASSLAVSPDGGSAYAASTGSDAVAVLDRDPDNGKLKQKTGTAGCISDDGTGGACVDGVALDTAGSVAVSPDGGSAYVASASSNAVAVFDRDPDTGELTQKAGTAGCLSEDGTSGECIDGKALTGARAVSVSPQGDNVYATAFTDNAVTVFDRQVGPVTSIGSGPTGTSADNTPTFTFASDTPGSSFECQVDFGARTDCASPFTTFALADGPHRFQVRATDWAGNTDPTPASRDFTVDTSPTPPSGPAADTTPPETELSSDPGNQVKTKKKKAKLAFEFSSSEADSTYLCSVDGGKEFGCESPYKTKVKAKKKAKKHTFTVRAVDAAGNADSSPAEWSGKVRRKKKG